MSTRFYAGQVDYIFQLNAMDDAIGGAVGTTVVNDAATTVGYITWTTSTGGAAPMKVTTTKLTYNAATGALTSTGGFIGTATAASTTTIVEDLATNANMPIPWVTTNTGNLPQKVSSTKLFFNPSTGVLTATGGFVGPMTVTSTANVAVVNDTTTNASMFLTWVTANSGSLPIKTTSTKLSFNPSTGVLTVTGGVVANVTGNASGTAANVTGIVAAANGGTGQSTYTVGDVLYASAATTLAKLAAVATGNSLISGGVGTAPVWGKIGLTTHVSGVLPNANGGTGKSTAWTQWGAVYSDTTGSITATAAGTTKQALTATTGNAPAFNTLDLTYLPDAGMKKAVKAATAYDQALSGGTAFPTIDGVTLTANDRVLLKAQALPAQNGIYIVGGIASAWTLTRDTDADTSLEITGGLVNVGAGTINGGKSFRSNFKSTDTIGTTPMYWFESTDGSTLYGFRNKIRNAKMEVNQRGTLPNTGYGLDGWQVAQAGGQVAPVTAAFDTATTSDCQVSLRLTVTTANAAPAATNWAYIEQNIEGWNVRDLKDNPTALRFEVRSSKTGLHSVALVDGGSTRSYVMTYNIAVANVWQTVYLSIPVGINTSAGSWNFGNGNGLRVRFCMMAGTTYQSSTLNAWTAGNFIGATGQVNCMDTVGNIFAVTGVQLEKGVTSTALENRDIATEVAIAQRYFRVWGQGCKGVWPTSTTVRICEQLPVQMRATPTVFLNITNPIIENWQIFAHQGSGSTIVSQASTTPTVVDVTINGFTGAVTAVPVLSVAYCTGNCFNITAELS